MHSSKKHEENYPQVHHNQIAANQEGIKKKLLKATREKRHYIEKNKVMDNRFLDRNNTSKKTVDKNL